MSEMVMAALDDAIGVLEACVKPAGGVDDEDAIAHAAQGLRDARAALAAHDAQPQEAQPVAPGFKLVPVEPTPEMIEAPFAGMVEDQSVLGQMARRKQMADDYRAMLAAAPAQPQEAQPVAREGWRLVPVMPTAEQVKRGEDAAWSTIGKGPAMREPCRAVYAAMLAAAPEPAGGAPVTLRTYGPGARPPDDTSAEFLAGGVPQPEAQDFTYKGGRRAGLATQHAAHIGELYSELLYAVGNKYPDETRHQTALRYIRQAEEVAARGAQGDGNG